MRSIVVGSRLKVGSLGSRPNPGSVDQGFRRRHARRDVTRHDTIRRGVGRGAARRGIINTRVKMTLLLGRQ